MIHTKKLEPINPKPVIVNPLKDINFTESFYRWWNKIAIILLSFHGLLGIYEAVKFMVVDYQKLELELARHQVQETEVNFLLAKFFVVSITTLLNMFMAIRLSKVKDKNTNNIDLLISTILVIGTIFFQNILIEFDLFNTFINLFLNN